MSRGRVVPATQHHVEQILEDGLRDADLKDITLSGYSPRQALEQGLHLSRAPMAVLVDGRAAAIFGVVPHVQDGVGCIWLLGTDRLLEIRLQFLRESRHWLEHVATPFSLLANLVHRDNHVHIHWLQWLGFTLMQCVGQFIIFARVQPCVTPSV